LAKIYADLALRLDKWLFFIRFLNSKEYIDNAKDMQKLVRDGLVSIEDGVVVDRGLSNTRLGKDGKLV